ncbi:MAG: ubiquinol-cytochrome c reductase iron-sulfur subunit [Mycobacteriaceae bacterium]
MSGEGNIPDPSREELAGMDRDALVRLGTNLDDVDVAYRSERWPVPGTRAEKRAERSVSAWFFLAGIAALAFVGVFLFWPWRYEQTGVTTSGLYVLYTPLLGITMGLAILGVGVGVIAYTKKFIPEEISVQQRHTGGSSETDNKTLIAELSDSWETSTLGRRKMLKRSLGFGAGALGIMAVMPLGGLLENPWRKGKDAPMWVSGWTPTNGEPVFLRRDTGIPDEVKLIRPEDMEAGALETVYPFRESERDNPEALRDALHHWNNAVMLIRLRPDDTARVVKRKGQEDFNYGDYFAYSKICTHLGCPTSLYEAQKHLLVCPCHQSQFDVLTYAKPVFGPAARALPQLPVGVDAEGNMIAKGDFIEAIGPGFWERRRA